MSVMSLIKVCAHSVIAHSALIKKCYMKEVLLSTIWGVHKFLTHLTDRIKLPETLKPEQNFFPILVPVQHDYIYPVCALSVLFIILWFWVSCSYFNTAERAVLMLLIGAYVRKLMNYSSNCLKNVVTFHVPNIACSFGFLLSSFSCLLWK